MATREDKFFLQNSHLEEEGISEMPLLLLKLLQPLINHPLFLPWAAHNIEDTHRGKSCWLATPLKLSLNRSTTLLTTKQWHGLASTSEFKSRYPQRIQQQKHCHTVVTCGNRKPQRNQPSKTQRTQQQLNTERNRNILLSNPHS